MRNWRQLPVFLLLLVGCGEQKAAAPPPPPPPTAEEIQRLVREHVRYEGGLLVITDPTEYVDGGGVWVLPASTSWSVHCDFSGLSLRFRPGTEGLLVATLDLSDTIPRKACRDFAVAVGRTVAEIVAGPQPSAPPTVTGSQSVPSPRR